MTELYWPYMSSERTDEGLLTGSVTLRVTSSSAFWTGMNFKIWLVLICWVASVSHCAEEGAKAAWVNAACWSKNAITVLRNIDWIILIKSSVITPQRPLPVIEWQFQSMNWIPKHWNFHSPTLKIQANCYNISCSHSIQHFLAQLRTYTSLFETFLSHVTSFT